MRKLLFLAPAFLAAGWLACSSDESSDTSGGTDAGTSPTTTATATPTATTTTGPEGGTPDTGAPAPKLASGDGFAVVYTDNTTIDARSAVNATFDASGFLTAYKASDNERPEIGAGSNDGAKTDGAVAVGRWIGGPTAGKFYSEAPKTYDAATDGFHWAVGKLAPSTATPSATTTYALDLAGSATAAGKAAAGHVLTFDLTFTTNADGGLPTVSATTTNDLGIPSATGAGFIATGGAATQVRGNGAVVFAGYFIGDAADRMIVAMSTPVHASFSLKKK